MNKKVKELLKSEGMSPSQNNLRVHLVETCARIVGFCSLTLILVCLNVRVSVADILPRSDEKFDSSIIHVNSISKYNDNVILIAQVEHKKKNKVILLSGFEPFGGFSTNSSWEAIKDFNKQRINGYDIVTVLLPVEYGQSVERFKKAIKRYDPEVVISFGLAPDNYIRLEKVAKNHVGSSADNSGVILVNDVIMPDGPLSYDSSLPLDIIYRALKSQQIEVGYSSNAGDYVCNYLFYNLMALNKEDNDGRIMGFIHVPPLSQQFKLSKLKKSIGIVLHQVILHTQQNTPALQSE